MNKSTKEPLINYQAAKPLRLLLLGILLVALWGCGQKGPLRRPDADTLTRSQPAAASAGLVYAARQLRWQALPVIETVQFTALARA